MSKPNQWFRENPPPTAEKRGIEDPVLEKTAEVDRRVGVIEGKTAVREEQELKDKQVELAQERRRRASEEQSVLRAHSPWRNRWPEVAKFDERVLEQEQRRAEIDAELQGLHDRERSAPAAHFEALAAWQLDGEQGPRPESELPAIKERIEQRRADLEASSVAIERIQDEKVAFVEKHRKRLVAEEDKRTDEQHTRLLAAIEELFAAREGLSAARKAAIWARLFPHESVAVEWPAQLVGGHAGAHRQLGLQRAYRLEELIGLLMADADWLREARTREQEAALRGVDPRHLNIGNTEWHDAPEAKAERARRMAEWAARP